MDNAWTRRYTNSSNRPGARPGHPIRHSDTPARERLSRRHNWRFPMKLHSKTALALVAATFAITAYAQDIGTLKKIKDTGTIVLGTRESSGALAFTLGDGKYVGFHTEMAEKIASDIQKQLGLNQLTVKYQPVTSQ